MRQSTLLIAVCIVLVCTALGSCTTDKPKGESDDSYTPQPMSRAEEPGNADKDAAGVDRGQKVFKQYCITCHMANGQGLSGVYPPLAGSEFLDDKQKTISAVANGLSGEIIVKGKKYSNVMPPIPGSYSNADIAAVVNYVMKKFGGEAWTTTEAEIAAIRKK